MNPSPAQDQHQVIIRFQEQRELEKNRRHELSQAPGRQDRRGYQPPEEPTQYEENSQGQRPIVVTKQESEPMKIGVEAEPDPMRDVIYQANMQHLVWRSRVIRARVVSKYL